jgi:hypothetical protein
MNNKQQQQQQQQQTSKQHMELIETNGTNHTLLAAKE